MILNQRRSVMLKLLTVVAVFIFAACEGPVGPMGPQGERGEQGEKGDRGERGLRGVDGEDGISAFVLVEGHLNDGAWNQELHSYFLYDPRIRATTVAEVYVKKFYTNTGEAYYMSIIDWLLVEDASDPVIVQVSSGLVRFYDPEQMLRNEVVAVAITLP